ncbi:MAG TPA: hypothetical protein VMV92_20810 [Streptosporangiaceae bacterium]|nr:hypothetical protein [Streptosporangiaceae bacterium]
MAAASGGGVGGGGVLGGDGLGGVPRLAGDDGGVRGVSCHSGTRPDTAE